MPDSDKAASHHLRRNQTVTLAQAAQQAPVLSRLLAQARQSEIMLGQVKQLVPPALQKSIQAGAVDGEEWCVIVPNCAAAAKLRQLSPALTAHLRSKGHAIQTIRLRVIHSHAG